MTTPVCRNPYDRPNGVRLTCTFVRNHADTCSWNDIRCRDLTEAADTKVDYTPAAVQAFLDSITRGDMDLYLEAILAVTHNRKRAMRGTPGFARGGHT